MKAPILAAAAAMLLASPAQAVIAVECNIAVDGKDVLKGPCLFENAQDGYVFSNGAGLHIPTVVAVRTGLPIDTAEMHTRTIDTKTGTFGMDVKQLGAVSKVDGCFKGEHVMVCASLFLEEHAEQPEAPAE
jgi:hypothetical protein